MVNLLRQSGQPEHVLKLVPEIVETCTICREWSKPLPVSIPSAVVASEFNQQVEIDLMFYKKHIVCHMVDRCTRWHASIEVDGKLMENLIPAIDKIWVGLHGPPKELIVDGETAIVRHWESHIYFDQKGIKVHMRAPNQHARFIERRGSILRDMLHRMDSQLASESISNIPFAQRLSEMTFAMNALLSIDGTSPYNAVYGRVPHLLPDINHVSRDTSGTLLGITRHAQRLRE